MEKAWRVSISNYDVGCYNCGYNLLTEKEKEEYTSGGDYCASCQYVVVDYVDRRSDYADYTIGYFDTEEEAENKAKELKPFSF